MKSSFCRLVPRVAFGLLVLFLFSSSASATSFVIPTDRELIAKADAIVRGVVMSRRVVQSDTGVIVTLYELAVTRSLKGDVKQGSFITVRTAGGHLGDRFLLVESAAHFSENDDVLLFLTSEDDGWTTTDMALGKFRPALTNRGYSVLIRDSDELSGRTRALVRKVRLESAFMRFIGDTVRGREPRESYEVDAAEAIAPSPDGGGWNVRGDARFPASTYSMAAGACEDEGSAVRWPTAVMNAGVEWFKNEANDLSGARGGGVGVIQSGLAAWTRDGGSAIDAQYAGTTRRLAGNDSQNTIVFDDPQNLIAGRWTGSGVIATTFVFGAGSHTFDGQTFLDVIDADIVFQDGYTASERTVEETSRTRSGMQSGFATRTGTSPPRAPPDAPNVAAKPRVIRRSRPARRPRS